MSPRGSAAAVLLLSCGLLSACSSAPRLSRSREAAGRALAATARTQIGRPYRFGGSSPKRGFDCSGLVWWTHKKHGIKVPRTTARQARGGDKVPTRGMAPGDVLFFTTYKRGPSHAGIYAGKGTFIHAPKTGRGVTETRLDNPYWKKRFLGVRRYY